MKLTFILVLAGLVTYANNSYSQATKLSMKMDQVTILEIFNEIESQSEFKIAYNSTKLDVNRKVDIDAKKQTVDKILDEVLVDQGLQYQIIDRYIVITDKVSDAVLSRDVQQKTVSGTVTNSAGETLPGVTVMVKGTSAGIVTDTDGNYSLVIPENGKILVFSYVGMLTQEVEIGNQSVINIVLKEDVIGIEEVIAVGYATQRKVNLTGSVAQVDAEKIGSRPITQTSSALQGLAPGVVVTQNLGSPGNDASTIRIRGRGSISSDNAPLILVDGIQVSNINDVNPEDIANMSVLKDAASASIYGARAANGVILITTKRGSKGKFSVNADISYGVQMPTMLPDMVDVKSQMLYEDVKLINEGSPIEWGVDRINDYMSNLSKGTNDQYQNNDWYDAVVAPSAGLHREQVVVSGGSEKVSARLSLVNVEQDGLLANTNFARKSLRSNIDLDPLDWMHFSTDIFIQRSERIQPPQSMGNIFQMLNELEPYRQLKVGDDLWGWAWRGENPLAFTEDGGSNTNENEYTLINLNANLTPTEGLNIDLGYSNLTDNNHITNFTEKFGFYEAGGAVGDPPQFSGYNPTLNSLNISSQYRTQNYYKATASYEKTFGNNYVKVLAGGDAIDFTYSDHFGSRSNFPLGQDYPQLSLGDREGMNNGSSGTSWSMASLLGRINYMFKDRYLLEATFRYDGSSRFASEKRWGFFPSVSAGWRVSEESFMQAINAISNLKIRASWGQLGNQNIGSNYPYQSLVDLNQPTVLNETSQLGAAITDWAVRGITWEKSEQTNIGLDFGFLGNKLSGSFDYYIKNTSDILLILALPQSSGLAPNYQNGAEMENKGWELVLNWEDKIGNISYYITGQIDDNKNKITNLLGTGPYISNDRIRQEGTEFDALYGWQSIGFLSKSDLTDDNVPKQASSELAEGSLKFRDQPDEDGNYDGVIDVNDRVVIGSEAPRYNFSFLTGMKYKGIGLDVILQGVGKRDGYVRRTGQSYGDHLYEWESDFYLPADHQIFTVHNYDQVGLEPNTNAKYPAIGSDNGNFSDFWIQSRAYLRVKNVTLSYTLPKSVTENLKFKNIRFYVSGENLYTFTSFIKGFDPEISSGRGYWQYPNISKVVGGVNLTF
ncbi:TonB-dependent receptor [uncultured Draconibacterium sp.]|uniref:TonB-dependent receptor n=1 Tax=uncultured Draconibacterium sp. TaxID=1573823 RepID=UPI0029C6EF79|nr:TonB-dependent receptor [uncultured Draconibacterium sp.]